MKTFGPSSIQKIKSIRGRSTLRSRSEHRDDNIPLDLTREPNDILKEILLNVSNQQPIATSRKLGHLNNLVKLLCNTADDSLIEFPMEVIMTCLKATLVSDVKEVRAAGVRALRYLINDNETKQIFMKLRLDHLITKCLDISHFNEVERIQAIRLVRKMAHLKASNAARSHEPVVPLSLFAAIVSVSLGGAEERDRVYRTCLAVLCELAVIQPWLVLRCNGVLALINAVLECHMYGRISECLCMSLMHLINHPSVSIWHKPDLNVGAIFAPYTELNYRLHPDVEDSKLKEEQEMRYAASKMAIVSLLRTWSGLFHVCQSKEMIRSFVEALLIPNPCVRKGILTVLCELFYLNELEWTDDFDAAVKAAAPGNFKDSWRLSEGFVAAEGKFLLRVRAVSRPDLVDCHLALLLSCFLQAGLLKCLTDVCLCADRHSSVGATVVLGSVLHLACHLLPGDEGTSSWKWQLPQLLNDNDAEMTMEGKHRRNVAIKQLQEIHVLLNRPSSAYSLHLSQLLARHRRGLDSQRRSSFVLAPSPTRSRSGSTSSESSVGPAAFSILKRHRSLNLMRDFPEEYTLAAIKSTHVLSTEENSEWDWDSLQCLFVSPPSVSFLRGVSVNDTVRRFYRRLSYFYLPTSKLFSAVELAKDGTPDHNRKFVTTACRMVSFLAHADEEGLRLLKNLVTAIVESLPKAGAEANGYSKAAGALAITCSREYFLILGSLSYDSKGDQILEQCKAYQYFLGLASESTHESMIKLLVSSLYYAEDSQSRPVLAKILTRCSEAGRLYGTGFLRVLLRANCPGFQRWGVELLATQLFDESNEVAAEALDILHEACDDREYLRAVVRLRPTLLHLGERGAILVCRFLSEPQGFAYLTQNHYLARELDRWWKEYNERYVVHVEELLKLSLTTYERPNKEEGFVRRSSCKKGRQSVYVPAHLYGELCRHADGARLVEREQITPRLTDTLRAMMAEDCPDGGMLKENARTRSIKPARLLKAKSCLWALAHIGSTALGLPLLQKYGSLHVLNKLARGAPVSSIRGTCLYCLSCIAQTIPGVEALRELGWKCVLRTVGVLGGEENKDQSPSSSPETFVTPRTARGSSGLDKSISSSSPWSTTSSPSHVSNRGSPRGSVSELSSVSDKGRPSRSRTSSRTTHSDPGMSFKIKNRRNSKKRSVQGDPSSLPSPGNTSVSIASSRSSVSDLDVTGPHNASAYSVKTPSPKAICPQLDGAGKPDNRSRRSSSSVQLSERRQSSHSEVNSTHSNNFIASKAKNRTRSVFDFIFKKSRGKTTNKQVVDRKRLPDEASSGYASDRLSLEQQEVNQEPMPIEESDELPPSPVDSLENGRLLSSTTLTSSSNVSVETIKVIDVGNSIVRVGSGKQKSSTFDGDANAAGDRNAVASWNTNNSGQNESVPPTRDGERVPGRSKFYVQHHEEEPRRCSRTQSLPNVLDLASVVNEPENTRSLLEFEPKPNNTRPSCLDLPTSGDRVLDWVPVAKFSDERPTDCPQPSGPNGHCASGDVTDSIRLLNPSAELPCRAEVSHGTVLAARFPPGAVADRSNPQPEGLSLARLRGDTQVSQDSGVGTDFPAAPSFAALPLDRVTVGSGESDLAATSAEEEDSRWRICQPTGLAAVRRFSQPPTSPVSPDGKRSYQEQIDAFLEKITVAERDDIINTTRYVGIAIPECFSTFLQPLNKITSRSEKRSATLLATLEESSRNGNADSLNPGKQKVIDLLQGRKFRGLDEYTFGPAVAAALKAGNKARSQQHSAVNTPCARTPDSMLSEASDLCCLGGQTMEPGSDEYVAILHEEIIQLVINLGSSVGIKAHETALLMMKEKRPDVFDSISLYNSIVQIMSEYCFRLTTRRFVQELFQDIHFTEVYQEAQKAVQIIVSL